MLFVANQGQAEELPLTIQITDGTGAASNPTGAVPLRVYYGDPAGTGALTLKATLSAAQQAGLTGFYAAFLDISDRSVFPGGRYVVRWDFTVAGVATATADFLQILDAPALAGTGAAGSSYCSESEVRNWIRALEDTVNVSSALVAAKAVQGAALIDAYLRGRYAVPFGTPFDPTIVRLNIWLAASYLLENRTGDSGDRTQIAKDLETRALEELEKILAGTIVLTVDPRTDFPAGQTASSDSTTLDKTRTFEFGEGALARF